MTTISKSSIASSKLLVAAALVIGMMSTASAYSDEQQQLCTSDAFRLCGSEIPDVDRVTACMVRHKSELSAGCKAVFGPAPAEARATPVTATPVTATTARASKPLNLVPAKTRRTGA